MQCQQRRRGAAMLTKGLGLLLLAAMLAVAAAKPMTEEQKAKIGHLRNRAATDAQYVREDLPYIRCGTCVSMVQQTLGVLGEMRERAAANDTKRQFRLNCMAPSLAMVDEGDLLDVIENLCDTDTHGLWIRWLDLQEKGDELELVNVGKGPGACGTECRTIAKACQDIIDSVDVLQYGEKVWAGLEAEPLAKALCREMTDVCVTPDPPLPKDRKPGPEWQDDSLPDWYVKEQAEKEKAAKAKKGARRAKKAGKKAKAEF